MTVEPVTRVAPRPVRRAVMAQRWRHVSFLHWSLDPERAATFLPRHLRPDLVDGVTHLGVVALRMEGTRLAGSPPLPYLGTFPQINVRLYTVDPEGHRGVFFLALHSPRFVPVSFARVALRLPYRWSRVAVSPFEGMVTYRCQPGRSGPVSRLAVTVDGPIREPGPLDDFLTARWGLHVRHLYLPNEHQPWQLYAARLAAWDDTLVSALLPGVATDPPVSVLYSPGVYARFGPPRAVRDERPPGPNQRGVP